MLYIIILLDNLRAKGVTLQLLFIFFQVTVPNINVMSASIDFVDISFFTPTLMAHPHGAEMPYLH